MEKTYKQHPFDIELAKKIQSGEVEGRIVNGFGRISRIICFDKKSDIYPVVALVKDGLSESSNESTYDFTKDGEILLGNSTNNDNLFIELPEETLKHEFKVGEYVYVPHLDVFGEIKSKNEYGIVVRVYSDYSYSDHDCSFAMIEPCKRIERHEEKHEFKPFDKVLVLNRNNKEDKWSCDFFSHKEGNGYVLLSGYYENFDIIPYEGNEHLVGTTDKPKEE